MATRIKVLPRLVLVAVAAIALFFAMKFVVTKYVSSAPTKSEVPKQANLPEVKEGTTNNVAAVGLPSGTPTTSSLPEIRFQVMAWNAQMGLMFANGGPKTTQGSLMETHGANVLITREDDGNKMQASLVAFATALQTDPQPKTGTHFVVIMGDGSAAFLAGLRPTLAKLGPQYAAEVIGSPGYSRGEDKFMGQPQWKDNPKTAHGAVVAGVLRDGDWNIAMKWAGDNDLRNNPDETTWDPEALNWMAANDFIDAGQKYIVGACEDRRVVREGKLTGETKHVCVDGVVTWTPGDVNVAHNKGGLVSIVSTKEYRAQMPATIIGIKKWDEANRTEVEALLAAMFEGGDQVKQYDAALHKAAEISAAVYKEESAEYWQRYYKGVTEADKQGLIVSLGGSSANNLNDNLQLYGLAPGSANIFAATYTTFGDIVVQQYPKLVSSYPGVTEVLNTSFVQNVSARSVGNVAAADLPKFTGGALTNVVSKKTWSITFQTGSANFTPEAQAQLRKLADDLLVADELAIELHGHTDNTGTDAVNMSLSERRAEAVRDWLMKQSSSNFPASRFTVIAHGSTQPVASNSTDEGRAKNRRVVVVLGTTN